VADGPKMVTFQVLGGLGAAAFINLASEPSLFLGRPTVGTYEIAGLPSGAFRHCVCSIHGDTSLKSCSTLDLGPTINRFYVKNSSTGVAVDWDINVICMVP
jgi:hypothetical protein